MSLGGGLDDLIKALQIFRKYGNPEYPTHCEHDVLYICIDPSKMDIEDIGILEKLGFSIDDETDAGFYSFRFGSA